MLDGSQAVVRGINVEDIGVIFIHLLAQLFGPTGTGVLYVNKKRINEMVPFNGGGEMIKVSQKTM